MTSVPLGRVTTRPPIRIATWQLFLVLAAAKIALAWVYDTRILPAVIGRMGNASKLPPEITALMASNDVLLMHFASTVVTFALSIAFVACCLQLALLGFGEAVALIRLVRAVLIASTALIVEASVRAAQLLASDVGVSIEAVSRSSASLATLVLSGNPASSFYALLDAATVFELLWCVLVAVQLTSIVRREVAIAVVCAVWVTLTAAEWGVMTYLPRLLI